VINSLLPMTDQRSGAFPLQNDYKDAFRDIPPGYVRGRGPVGRHRIFGPRNPTVTVDSSHIARKPKPSKAIQGEKEEEDDKPYPHHLFPKKALRARRLDSSSSSNNKRRVFGRRGKKKKDRAKMTPEEKRADDLAEKKEQLQKNLEMRRAFMNKRLMDRIKHDKINPILRDKASFKRRDPTKLFIKQTATPLWPAISVINNNLRRFCEKHPHVTFFDATDIFAERTERGAYILKSDMISVRGHPTEAGFRAWEDNVASKLTYMLKDKPAKVKVGDTQSQPSNVLPAGNPAVSEPKPPAAQKKEEKPKDDGISESELSGDESKDDGNSSEDEETEKTAKEDGTEESEEDGSGDKAEGKEEDEEEEVASDDNKAESESQDADNSAESEEEEDAESDDDEDEPSADDAGVDDNADSEEAGEEEEDSSEEPAEVKKKKATRAKKTGSTKKAETAKETTKKKATPTKKEAKKKKATKKR